MQEFVRMWLKPVTVINFCYVNNHSYIANQHASILIVFDIYCRYVSSFKLLGICSKVQALLRAL